MRTMYSEETMQDVIPRLDRGIQKTLDCLSSASHPGRPLGSDNDKSLMTYRCLYRTQDGFTLTELMITMVIFVIAMMVASNIFTGILTQFKQQSSIAESNIAGIGGLEMMRHDIEQAGYGLAWNMNNANYPEADANATYDPAIAVAANSYNDAAPNAPRGVIVGNNVLMNQSDILAIKATNVATSAASQKWEYIVNNGALPNTLREWDMSSAERIQPADHVIVLNPSAGLRNQRVLSNSGGFDLQLNSNGFSFNNGGASAYTPFEPPAGSYTAYLAYGVSPSALRMPFNRADFYIKRPADIPSRCAQGTGVLYKATVNHADGMLTELPLLDCVLDMQVVVAVDTDDNGAADQWWDNTDAIIAGSASSEWARLTRTRVKEIRVYLVVQEGQKDMSYNSPATITISDPNITAGPVKTDDLNAIVGADYKYYRWKLHAMVVTPYNLQ